MAPYTGSVRAELSLKQSEEHGKKKIGDQCFKNRRREVREKGGREKKESEEVGCRCRLLQHHLDSLTLLSLRKLCTCASLGDGQPSAEEVPRTKQKKLRLRRIL